jgi:hypothetical protein
MSTSSRWPTLALVLAVVAGCGGKKRQTRTHDGGTVEPIAAPVFGDAAVKATNADEVEPNDNDDVATPLPPGGVVHGRIEPETDADFYRIDVGTDGVLAVEVSAVDNTDLTLEIHDANGAVLARSDRGAAKTKEGVPNVGVARGRYVAVVRAKKIPVKGKKPANPPPAPPALPYDITAQVAPLPANAEREPDDDRGTANDLLVGEPVTGYAGWSGDADVWKLSVEALSARNAIDLEVAAVEGIALTVEIADGIGKPLLVRKAPRGAAVAIRGLVPAVAAGAPPYHYVTIKGTPSNPESAYTLRVTAKVHEPDTEVEPNDTLERPMPIPSDRTIVTGQWSPGDVDCLAIAPDPAPRNLEIAIQPPAQADLSAELVVDGKVVATSNTKGKGAVERLVGAVPANGRAVVRIRGTDASIEGTYELKLTEGPPPADKHG